MRMLDISDTQGQDRTVLRLVAGSDVRLKVAGEKVVEGHGMTMNVTWAFSLVGRGGGEGTLTYRPETQNTEGIFMSGDGTIHYLVEPCGHKCTVLYQADLQHREDYKSVKMTS